jgi:hypothetical protein
MSTDGDRVVRGNRLGKVFYREIIQPSPNMLSIGQQKSAGLL